MTDQAGHGAVQDGDDAAEVALEVEVVRPEWIRAFDTSWPAIEAFADLLELEGELRGLIGPRELPRLWSRHLLNCAAVATLIEDGESVIDVGSGAGFPGLVIAAMRPSSPVRLVEPMERRCEWLHDAVEVMGLGNVTVQRARADEIHTVVEADVVTARAVAALPKLARWCMPLVAPGGRFLAMKGQKAAAEVEEAKYVLRKLKATYVDVRDGVCFVEGTEPTTVVEIRKKK